MTPRAQPALAVAPIRHDLHFTLSTGIRGKRNNQRQVQLLMGRVWVVDRIQVVGRTDCGVLPD